MIAPPSPPPEPFTESEAIVAARLILSGDWLGATSGATTDRRSLALLAQTGPVALAYIEEHVAPHRASLIHRALWDRLGRKPGRRIGTGDLAAAIMSALYPPCALASIPARRQADSIYIGDMEALRVVEVGRDKERTTWIQAGPNLWTGPLLPDRMGLAERLAALVADTVNAR